MYFAGDGAEKDEDLWLLGRIDDVMNISGHRISTAEIEHALVGDTRVAEAAVVLASDPTTGQAIVAFGTVKGDAAQSEAEGRVFVESPKNTVVKTIAPIASRAKIMLTSELPKTRSGKIMRRLLRDVAERRELGDVSTLMAFTVVKVIEEKMHSAGAQEQEA